jgi:phosphatidylserine/phosphatidylglycerophosphate/cardiolipin synthase-like enzyme
MSNCIVRAEREFFLATNFWQNSDASKFITDAIKELSRRAGERGIKIIAKVIYDRGSPKQLVEPHYVVPVKEYTGPKVGLPAPEEIPNIDMQVMNYHHPLLGTFHSKYMIVDRKMAVIQSNNIQSNDNLEMMTHLEGPIVDSMYDMALLSWHKRLEPPLPSYNHPAAKGGISCFTETHNGVFGSNGSIRGHHTVVDPEKMQPREAYDYTRIVPQPGKVDGRKTEAESNDTNRADATTGPSTTSSVVPNTPDISTTGSQSNRDGTTSVHNPDPKTADFLSDGQQANHEVPVPPSTAENLPESTTDHSHWDLDIAGEVLRVQAAVSAKEGETTMQAVNRHLNNTINAGFPPDAPECSPEDEMTPYIPHPVHEPFPMALVNRAPYGPPNHKSVVTPQNAAWLSALRNAKKNVFIQSPTLNAAPLVPAIAEACERGIDVYCYICLGYNDTGELLPMQGGHNDMVAHQLLTLLSPEGKQHLHYFWYVAKDQTRPIIQEKKKRSCHIKLMIADEHIGIMGNGNQDTQSWYHSQEINVMLDSAAVCRAWIDGLRRNQNTHLYGALDREAGVWVDADGKQADGAIGVDPGRFAWARGVVGAVKRLQGTGGF